MISILSLSRGMARRAPLLRLTWKAVVVITKPKSAEKIAARMLDRHGLAFIWDTHVAAAAAYGLGQLSIAEDLTEIAEAAEQLWLQSISVKVSGWTGTDSAPPDVLRARSCLLSGRSQAA